jgi:hypothetical protein
MPKNMQFKWAWGYYEMRYVYFPEEVRTYSPTWINYEFLEKGVVRNGNLIVGDASYRLIYVDAEYLDYKVVKRLLELAQQNVEIVIKRKPREPGFKKHKNYDEIVSKIFKYKNVGSYWHPYSNGKFSPFKKGETMPLYWIRKDIDTFYIFIANPKSSNLKFPMEYGQSLQNATIMQSYIFNQSLKIDLVFPPYQSKLIKIWNDNVEEIDISFIPKRPEVRKRPDNYEAPWLVK